MKNSSEYYPNPLMGDWPQRLLHVPTMTSYEWQDGHKYGTFTKPEYSAISYTWGRYSLNKPDDQSHVKSVQIKGLTWDVPRINETHFTVTQFETLIRRSIEPFSNPNIAYSSIKFEFVWLDIACINQTRGHSQMAVEIGRQAKIFRKAKRVLVWLNGTACAPLERAIQKLGIAADSAEEHTSTLPGRQRARNTSGYRSKIRLNGKEDWLRSAIRYLKEIIKDRWFSSLWTLQEAFLCQWAYVISAEVEGIRFGSPQLGDIFQACATLSSICKRSVADKRASSHNTADTEIELIEIIEEKGLAALAVENPMALYTAASNRVTTRPEDRIYGIMQVFNFTLGISAPDVKHDATFDLPKLELQLGQQLLQDYPMMSQLHVHCQPVDLGQGWRVSSSSVVPDLVRKVPFHRTSSFLGNHTSLCQLSWKMVNGVTWGTFSGSVCDFEHLEKAWRLVHNRDDYEKSIKGKSTQQIALDFNSLQSAFSENPQLDIPRGQRQHKLAQELIDCSKKKGLSVIVMLLGRFSDDQHRQEFWELAEGRISEFFGERYNIGLILAKQREDSEDFWQRLGLCIWDLSHLRVRTETKSQIAVLESLASPGLDVPEKELLEGTSPEWKIIEGLFG